VPILKKDGFRGSGRKYYKHSGQWLQLLNVQGSRYGGSFAVNLAIHYATAPDLVGNVPDPAKMTEAHCELRRRLAEDRADMWWKHESNTESMLEAVQSASAMYEKVGRKCFAQAIETLDSMTADALAHGSYDLQGFHPGVPRLGLALARIRKLQGRAAESRTFAAVALRNLEVVVHWKAELEALAANDA
jgi:hypothetical protein